MKTPPRNIAALPPYGLLTSADVLRLLGISRVTLFRWIRDGAFPAAGAFLPGGQRRWRKDIVEAWIRQGEGR